MSRTPFRARVLTAVLIGLVVSVTAACGAPGAATLSEAPSTLPSTLRVGVIATGSAGEVSDQYEHTAQDLSTALGGVEVEMVASFTAATAQVRMWVAEIEAWPAGTGGWFQHDEQGEHGVVRTRTENFTPDHDGLRAC